VVSLLAIVCSIRLSDDAPWDRRFGQSLGAIWNRFFSL
jgi:hypothetical protein